MLTRKRLAAAAIITAIVIMIITVLSVRNQKIMRFFKRETVISVAGDILLDRGVANAIDKNGPNYPYEGVALLFNQDDITIANLECPLTQTGGGAMKSKRFVFKAHPDNALAIKSAGFDVLMLANNHTMDYLSQGLADTMETLDNAGLLYAGAGRSKAEIRPCFINKNGVRVGILSYSSLPPEGLMYDGDSATVAYAREGFLDNMRNDIMGAADQCDFLIVYFHWGIEYRHDVSDAQIEIARAAVDSGASSVIGTHPHVLQGREIYNGAPIYYSIGNFVFDKQLPEGTDEALILQFTVNKNGIVDTREIPVVINECQPVMAEGQKANDIMTNIKRYSRRFE